MYTRLTFAPAGSGRTIARTITTPETAQQVVDLGIGTAAGGGWLEQLLPRRRRRGWCGLSRCLEQVLGALDFFDGLLRAGNQRLRVAELEAVPAGVLTTE